MVVSQKAARIPLSSDRVLSAAVALADTGGLEALTMRGLAETLDVEAMSLYYHVANKEALLDGVVEQVVGEVNEAVAGLDKATGPDDWKGAVRKRILTAREVMLRHKWAPAVIETRTSVNPSTMMYYHGMLEMFRAGGLSYDLIHHAMHALGSRALGFTQELFDPAPGSDDEEMSDEVLAQMATQVPLLVEMLSEITHDDDGNSTLGWCDDQTEFEFALDILLDGIDRLARAEG